MAIDRKALRKWLADINDVLNRDWDPIGVFELFEFRPKDEYVSYAESIASMLHRNANDEEILRYLERLETESMGLSGPFDRERGKKVIAAIRALPMPRRPSQN